MTAPLVSVTNLRVNFPGSSHPAVDNVSLEVQPGQCVALVGESGSGKTLTALSLLGLTPAEADTSVESCVIAGTETRGFSDAQWRPIRGSTIALVSQDALVSLDPLRRVEQEVAEVLELAKPRPSSQEISRRVDDALEAAAVGQPEVRRRQYPHELSGGLRQRALIASAIAAGPRVIVADEPTTALDSLSQAQILSLLERLKRSGIALVLVSHDIGLVSQIADQIGVMSAGQIVERGSTKDIVHSPRHRVTRGLIDAAMRRGRAEAAHVRKQAHPATPALTCSGVGRIYHSHSAQPRRAIEDVTFELVPGTTVGIVGESGSGKSTLARVLMGLEQPDSGDVLLGGEPWSSIPESERRPRRGAIQLIEQNPYDALDPRWSVARVLGEAIELDRALRTPAQRRERRRELLGQVGLSEELMDRRAHQLSGGQRQRVAIARALARRPQVLVCDEPVSALDATVQAQILDLLASLQKTLGLSMVIISHDVGVIAQVSHTVLVMHEGRVVESGRVDTVMDNPQHRFTRELLAASTAILA